MSKGIEDVKRAVALCREATQKLESFGAKTEGKQVSGQLLEIISQLEGLQSKFFLKTNLSVRFTSSCLKVSEKIENNLTAMWDAKSGDASWGALVAEVEELAKKVQLLAEKSTAEGDIVIT